MENLSFQRYYAVLHGFIFLAAYHSKRDWGNVSVASTLVAEKDIGMVFIHLLHSLNDA